MNCDFLAAEEKKDPPKKRREYRVGDVRLTLLLWGVAYSSPPTFTIASLKGSYFWLIVVSMIWYDLGTEPLSP
jgi:hypothetical protein